MLSDHLQAIRGKWRKKCLPILAAIILSSCNAAPTPTPRPTKVLPTITPVPTARPTSEPTRTPLPTKELRPGIDTPVELGSDVTLKFSRLIITQDYYNPEVYGEHFIVHSGVGQTGLAIEGTYTGDLKSVFGDDVIHIMQEGHPFYIESLSERQYSVKYYAFAVAWSGAPKGLYYIVFIIDTGDKGPFRLHDKVHGWIADLSSLPIVP